MKDTGSTGLSISTNFKAGCNKGTIVYLKYSLSLCSNKISKSDFFGASTSPSY